MKIFQAIMNAQPMPATGSYFMPAMQVQQNQFIRPGGMIRATPRWGAQPNQVLNYLTLTLSGSLIALMGTKFGQIKILIRFSRIFPRCSRWPRSDLLRLLE